MGKTVDNRPIPIIGRYWCISNFNIFGLYDFYSVKFCRLIDAMWLFLLQLPELTGSNLTTWLCSASARCIAYTGQDDGNCGDALHAAWSALQVSNFSWVLTGSVNAFICLVFLAFYSACHFLTYFLILPCKTGNPEIVSFYLNTASSFAQ